MMDDGEHQDNELTALDKALLSESADPVHIPFSLLKSSKLAALEKGLFDERADPVDIPFSLLKSSKLAALEKGLLDERADPVDIPFSLLKAITGNFSEAQVIGSGGFGVVYKGLLPSGGIVAVKKLFEKFEILDKNFESEVACLVGVKHKNTVRFLGHCSEARHVMMPYEGKLVCAEERQRLLCFEYLPKGCLADYLSDASCRLQWTMRYQIIKGICEGVHYLHQKRIIHMDLKPQNVLLDDNMVPRIADFGLSRRLSESKSRAITENMIGTNGYMAPEFINKGEITFKTDIYSLGIIIMEILMGHKECSDVKEVVESWTNKFGTSKSQTTLKQVKVCAEIGIKCTNCDPGNRPSTCFIIRLFEKLCEVEISNWSITNDVATSTKGQISFSSQLTNELKLMDDSAEPSQVQPSTPVEWEDGKLSLERKGKGARVSVSSVSTGVMSKGRGKLTTFMGDEDNKRKEVRKQAPFLEKELSTINAAFEQLELIDKLAPWVKNWRDDVRENFLHDASASVKGSLGAVVKLLPCDHEVMASSPGNSLLPKCTERLGTKDPKWSDPSRDPAQAGATCTGLPFFYASASVAANDLSLVRSLTISGSVHKSVLDFSKFEALRVLDIEECELEDKHLKVICSKLLLLRYLRLGASVKALPEEIKNLRFLNTLDVRRTQIQILPTEVIKLPCLVHLFGKFKLQQGVGGRRMLKLQTWSSDNSKLQTVAGFVVDSNNNSQGFEQLIEHMKNLTKVKIWCEQSSNSNTDPIARRRNLSRLSGAIKGFIERSTDLKKAHSLSLNFGDECSQDFLNFSLEEQDSSPSCYLSSLKLHGNSICSLPPFVTMLGGLTQLCLSFPHYQLSGDILAALSRVRCLAYLKLIAYQLDRLIFIEGALESLRRLCIVVEVMTELEVQEGALPLLKSLHLLCTDINGFSVTIQYLQHIEEVALHDGLSYETKQEWKEAANNHPRRPKLMFVKKNKEVDMGSEPVENSKRPAVPTTDTTLSVTVPHDAASTGQSVQVDGDGLQRYDDDEKEDTNNNALMNKENFEHEMEGVEGFGDQKMTGVEGLVDHEMGVEGLEDLEMGVEGLDDQEMGVEEMEGLEGLEDQEMKRVVGLEGQQMDVVTQSTDQTDQNRVPLVLDENRRKSGMNIAEGNSMDKVLDRVRRKNPENVPETRPTKQTAHGLRVSVNNENEVFPQKKWMGSICASGGRSLMMLLFCLGLVLLGTGLRIAFSDRLAFLGFK